MLDTAEQDARLNEIAALLVHLAPGGTESMKFAYSAVGTSFEQAAVPYGFNRTEALLPFTGIYSLLRDLRSRMHVEGDGTWLEMDLKVELRPASSSLADGGIPRWEVRFKSVDEITFMDEIPPAAAAEELRMFPQEPHRVPEWMAELAAAQEAADRFEPDGFAPQPETDLEAALPDGLDGLFAAARDRLLDFLPPENADRFLVGRLAEGCWSVVHLAPAWLAVRMKDGVCAERHAYTDPAAAAAAAAGAVIAEAGVEVNSSVLRGAGVLSETTAPRMNIDAWTLDSSARNGIKQIRRTIAAERPRPATGRGRRYFALLPLANRPGGYFVVHPSPVPAKGDFVSTHEIFAWHVRSSLPKAKVPPPAPDETVTLEAGTELDTYDGDNLGTLFTIGTPFERRQLHGYPEDTPYRVYRLLRPLEATVFVPDSRTVYRPGERGPKRLPDERGRAYVLERSIRGHLEAGDIVEISEPGGTPVPLRDKWDFGE
ncbi:glycohydrolase toxin TNT-related protein [Actinomadura sp. K4S16]|uniref:glycohydrolase toxin TNT-related protein n=1 Tax=Actinomadura sp. K4S16 TaxID=1316147 RepID=UPI0011EC7A01|nr:glycohydrolase toxin TNT-related protein [Actinomadura sp. K4S16]